MARKKGSEDYPLETKLEVIRLWEKGGLPYKEITKRLAIRDPNRARIWTSIYRKERKGRVK